MKGNGTTHRILSQAAHARPNSNSRNANHTHFGFDCFLSALLSSAVSIRMCWLLARRGLSCCVKAVRIMLFLFSPSWFMRFGVR